MTSSPRIEPTLLRLLTARDGTPFTRDALLAEYRTLSHEHGRTGRAAWQFIDRNIRRLASAGVLTSLQGATDQPPRYRLAPTAAPAAPTPMPDALSVLRQRLQRHRVELLSTIGETEAYDEICSELPALRSSVQAQYNESKDRSLKLLGRIRALETLIATQCTCAA